MRILPAQGGAIPMFLPVFVLACWGKGDWGLAKLTPGLSYGRQKSLSRQLKCDKLGLFGRRQWLARQARHAIIVSQYSETSYCSPNSLAHASTPTTLPASRRSGRWFRFPLWKFGIWNFSLGACRLSSGRPKPIMTLGILRTSWKLVTIGIDPPLRMKTVSFLNASCSASVAALMYGLSVPTEGHH